MLNQANGGADEEPELPSTPSAAGRYVPDHVF